MEIVEAIKVKLKTSSQSEESAWRADFNAFCNDVDPIQNKNAREAIKNFTQQTVGLINLKAAMLIQSLKENLVTELSEGDFDNLQEFILSEIAPEKYFPRFNIIVDSTERKFQRYGVSFNHDHQGVKNSESLFNVGVSNISRLAQHNIIADITLLRVNNQVSNLQTINNIVELKPNIFGIGLNLNALIDKINGWKNS